MSFINMYDGLVKMEPESDETGLVKIEPKTEDPNVVVKTEPESNVANTDIGNVESDGMCCSIILSHFIDFCPINRY